MACGIKLIRTTFLPGGSTGGQWELVGYSVEPTGPFGSGGNWPWTSINNDNPSVNFNNIDPGYYKLNYFRTGTCGGQQEVIIPVASTSDAGVSTSTTICNTSAPVDIANLLGVNWNGGILESTFEYSGSGVTSPGFSISNPNDPTTAIFDPSLVSAGVYTVTLEITPNVASSYTFESCCLPTSATLIITVQAGQITLALGENCILYLANQSGCPVLNPVLWENTGSGWVSTPHILPYQATENAQWKVINTCTCGPVESNVVESTGCCTASPVSIYFDPDLCAIIVSGSTGCTSGAGATNQFKWYRSCNGGVSWEHLPNFDGDLFIFANDSCSYQFVHPCSNGCVSRSNIVTASGCSSCSGTLAVTMFGCTYRVVAGPNCVDGVFSLKKGTTTIATKVASDYPVDFVVPSNGIYYVELDCGNGCPIYDGPGFTFNSCGAATCNSSLALALDGCTIEATVTNCPSPVFTFINPNGTIVQTGSTASFVATLNGLWTVQLTGCPNCSTIISTITVTGCQVNPCVCSPVLEDTDCGDLTTTACSGYTTEWQYRTDPSSNWGVVQSGGTTYTASVNGQYRVQYTKSGCPEVYSNILSVSCFVVPCTCVPVLTLSSGPCQLTYTATACSGYVLFLQRLTGGVWVDVTAFPANPYTVPVGADDFYRLKGTHANCPTVYSNIVYVNCAGGACSIDITQFELNACGEIEFAWSNTSGVLPILTWQYASVNPTNCSTAGGWVAFSPTGTWGQAGFGGSGLINVNDYCDRCIRLTITDSCGSAQEKLFVPCCCTDTPTIDDNTQSSDYRIELRSPISGSIDVFGARNSGTRDMEIYSNADYKRSINGGAYSTLSSEEVSGIIPNVYTQCSRTNNTVMSGTDYVKEIKFKVGGTTHILDMDPSTSPYLTGSFGTIASADLMIYSSGVPLATARTAINNQIRNAIKSVVSELVADDVLVHLLDSGSTRHVEVYLRVKWGSSTYIDNNVDYLLKHNVSTNHVIPTTDKVHTFDDDETTLLITKSNPCGNLTLNTVIDHYPNGSPTQITIEGKVSWFMWSDPSEVYPIYSTIQLLHGSFGVWDVYGTAVTQTTTSCAETILTVLGECSGATYLWSTGATTESITVGVPGLYSVLITCPDGCEYTINITI